MRFRGREKKPPRKTPSARGPAGRYRSRALLTWVPLLVAIVGVGVSIFLWRTMLVEDERALMLALEDEALHVASDMRAQRLQRVGGFSRMAQRVARPAELDRDQWEREARALFGSFRTVDVLMWVHEGEADRWVAERPEPEALSDPGLTEEIRRAMTAAAAAGEERYASNIVVAEMIGEAVVIPIFRNDAPAFLVVVSRVPDLFGELMTPGIRQRYAVVVEDEDGRRYSFGAEPAVEDLLSSWVSMEFNGVAWGVRVAPAGPRWAELQSPLPEAVLVFGVLVSLLLSTTTFSIGLAGRRADIAEDIEHSLTEEVEERRRTESELRRNQAYLEALAERLKRGNEDLERFSAVVAHDLKEPLLTVGLYVDAIVAELDEGETEEAALFARRVTAAVDKMTRLIDALLAHSRATTADMRLEPVSLSEVIQMVCEDLRGSVQRSGGALEVGDLPVLEADWGQMKQLFQNIVSNAVKFRREEEPPYVRIEAEPVTSPSNGESLWWRITVSDNGIGFDVEEVDRLFIEFSRLPRAKRYEGSGMGLAICRRIVERHGGFIRAMPNIGRPGAMIEILLPARRKEPATTVVGAALESVERASEHEEGSIPSSGGEPRQP